MFTSARPLLLIPKSSLANHALMGVIGMMSFLASLSAGMALLVFSASQQWQHALGQEMTIQIRPHLEQGQETEKAVEQAAQIARQTAGIQAVRVFTSQESAQLLEPWLGKGLDLNELPIPRMIVLKLAASTPVDLPHLRQNLQEQVPSAILDDHVRWQHRFTRMAQWLVGGTVLIFGLVVLSMILAVAFAARSALAECREMLETLHFVGAQDPFIVKEFQSHFRKLALRGSLMGSAGAMVFFLFLRALMGWWGGERPEARQMDVMFGSFSLDLLSYGLILLMAFGVAWLTGLTSRLIVAQHLKGLY